MKMLVVIGAVILIVHGLIHLMGTAATVLSLALTALDWNVAFAGIAIDVVILVALFVTR